MNKKHLKGWLKHGDFILLDILCLQFSFVLAYWLVHGYGNPYDNPSYQYQAVVLFASQVAVIAFADNYSGILRRKKFDEAIAMCRYLLGIFVLAVIYLFAVHHSAIASRLQFGFTSLFFLVLGFLSRCANKERIFKFTVTNKNKRSIVLITAGELVNDALEKLTGRDTYQDFFVSGIILMDSDRTDGLGKTDIPIMPLGKEAISKITHDWVDEVLILQPETMAVPFKLMEELTEMGITVNYSMPALGDEKWPVTDVRKLGKYIVMTNSIRFATAGQMAAKRFMDICGGLVGCVAAGIIFIFIAPAIYRKSPGPLIFSQERVGQNGKTFKMYKFRSMYLDAEERKAALMSQNKIQDGMMFKLDDDPRIIGSEKKDKNGRPKGIGNFIRRTSLDEFPQFFNVLKGDMSLVGWRPATLDEWKKYKLQHRIRASMKPGITGMWQVSGRSQITDFNEVVRLDREYIENWSIALDIKLLLKTVEVVFTRRGAE